MPRSRSFSAALSRGPALFGALFLFSVLLCGCADECREARLVGFTSSDSCLTQSAVVPSGEGGGEAQVEVFVDGLRVYVDHKNAMFNCCLDAIVVSFTRDGGLLMLREEEKVTMPCDCICPFEVSATIDVPSTGTYTLEIYSGPELVWRDEVEV
jgi:hypothetical protein